MTSTPPARRLILTSEYGFDLLRPEIRSGEIELLRRGAWVPALAAGVDRWRQHDADLVIRCRAVASTLSTCYAFSNETAAALRGWQAPRRDTVEIVQRTRPGQSKSADIVRHFCPDLAETDIETISGLPVLRADRTAVDCALGSEPPVALAIVDSALRQMAGVTRFDRTRSIERQDIIREQLLELLAERGSVRHIRRARAVLTHANGLAEYAGESWMRWLALVHGLPVPELQLPIAFADTAFYTDLMWTAATLDGHMPVIAEYDGVDKYELDSNPGLAVVKQTDREQRIVDATRATFLRFTRHDRANQRAAARRLLRAFPGVERTPRPNLLVRPARRPS